MKLKNEREREKVKKIKNSEREGVTGGKILGFRVG